MSRLPFVYSVILAGFAVVIYATVQQGSKLHSRLDTALAEQALTAGSALRLDCLHLRPYLTTSARICKTPCPDCSFKSS
jgi:hypothetical protein